MSKTSHFVPLSMMSRAELDEEIDALYAERASARRDPSLPWDGARLEALQKEAAARIPEWPGVDHVMAAEPCDCAACLAYGPTPRREGSR